MNNQLQQFQSENAVYQYAKMWRNRAHDNVPPEIYDYPFEAPPLLKYVHRKNKTKGVIICFLRKNLLHVGYSLTNFSLGDTFKKRTGLATALDNALPITRFNLFNVPCSIQEEVAYWVGRSMHYYQQAILPPMPSYNEKQVVYDSVLNERGQLEEL